MILQIPEVFIGIGYYEGVSLILWIITIALFLVGAVLFLIKLFKEEVKMAKIGFLSMAVFLLFFGLCRISYLVAVYDPVNYDFHTTLGYVFSIISLIFILYLIETQFIKSTKKIFTISILVVFVISIISLIGLAPRYIALMIMYIILPFSVAIIMLMYIYIIIKSAGSVRRKGILIFIGIALTFLAHLLDSEVFISMTYPTIPLEMIPIFMIVGQLFMIYAYIFYKTR